MQDYNEAEKVAEESRRKVLQVRQELEENIRVKVQAEMENKLSVEREARERLNIKLKD